MITNQEIQSFNTNRTLLKGDNFIYLHPHPGLRDWISNYTITFPGKVNISDQYTVIPHGSATLVFACSRDGIRGELFGPATMPSPVGSKANQAELLFIVEFMPAGLSAITKIDQQELADLMIPFELVNSSLNRQIAETIAISYRLDDLLNCIDRLFLSNNHLANPPELNLSIDKIIERKGNITTRELAACAFYSDRQLNRIFNRHLGMNLKTFSRLVRINKAIKLLQNPHSSITKVCIASGFYDSPHFIHDFKSVCGLTPQEYRHNMSDFYSEVAKF